MTKLEQIRNLENNHHIEDGVSEFLHIGVEKTPSLARIKGTFQK